MDGSWKRDARDNHVVQEEAERCGRHRTHATRHCQCVARLYHHSSIHSTPFYPHQEPPQESSKRLCLESPLSAAASSTANRLGGASSSTATSATDSTTDRPNHPDETRDDEATESTNGADDYADEESHDPFGTGWHSPDDDTCTGEWDGIVDFSKPWVSYISPDDSEEITRMKRERARLAADRLHNGGDPYGDYTRRENGEALR